MRWRTGRSCFLRVHEQTGAPLYGALCPDWIKWAQTQVTDQTPCNSDYCRNIEQFNTHFHKSKSLTAALIWWLSTNQLINAAVVVSVKKTVVLASSWSVKSQQVRDLLTAEEQDRYYNNPDAWYCRNSLEWFRNVHDFFKNYTHCLL